MVEAFLDYKQEVLVVKFGSKNPTVANGSAVVNGSLTNGNDAQQVEAVTSSDCVKTGEFPFCWLRDNCQCPDCCHGLTKNRTFLLRNLDVNIQPLSCELKDDIVHIEWPDHHSVYPVPWLDTHRFSPDRAQTILDLYEAPEFLWCSADMQDQVVKFSYDQLMVDDHVLLDWLLTLERTGIALITGAPRQEGSLRRFCDRVGPMKMTHYDETFSVKSKANPTNVAYTAKTLGLHSDLPPIVYAPGMQMLHCITQITSPGGENIFADAFRVANEMKTSHPEAFRILNETMVMFEDIGETKFHMLSRKPVFGTDDTGRVRNINYNNQLRAAKQTLTVAQVKPFYQALTQFEALLMDPKFFIRHKMNNGEIACFHNFRVLHGREGYDVRGERHLEGGYIDWDFLRSRRRILQRQLNV